MPCLLLLFNQFKGNITDNISFNSQTLGGFLTQGSIIRDPTRYHQRPDAVYRRPYQTTTPALESSDREAHSPDMTSL